jgi:ectoine hydroxylase
MLNILQEYHESGFMMLPAAWAAKDLAAIASAVRREMEAESSRRVFESDGRTVRAVHGVHLNGGVLAAITRHPVMLDTAIDVLGGDVYVYQTKVNAKHAERGERWEWHQDFVFWNREDGMPEPQALNIGLFVTDVSHDNGPLVLIPGSHKRGVISPHVRTGRPSGYELQPAWIENVTADLKYSIPQREIERMVSAGTTAEATGCAGTMILFHPNVVHSSARNTSASDRLLFMVTYNRCDNAPLSFDRRPDFLCGRDMDPLTNISLDGWNAAVAAEPITIA